jgi:hypothetical protein
MTDDALDHFVEGRQIVEVWGRCPTVSGLPRTGAKARDSAVSAKWRPHTLILLDMGSVINRLIGDLPILRRHRSTGIMVRVRIETLM